MYFNAIIQLAHEVDIPVFTYNLPKDFILRSEAYCMCKENKEWDEFFGDLELVEGAPYTVNVADKTGNTPAYQNFKKGMKNKASICNLTKSRLLK